MRFSSGENGNRGPCAASKSQVKDAGYVLDTFPIVRRQDDAQFGSYRTRDLILAYMNALAAGDAETVVSV